MGLTQVNSGGIEDGSIVNADIKSDAAIAGSKLVAATTSVPGSMSAADKTKLDGVATSATAVGGATGVDFNDNVKARFGTGNDFKVHHDGSNSYIENDTGVTSSWSAGNHEFKSSNGNTRALFKNGDACELYYNNNKCLETRSDGGIEATDGNFIVGTSGHGIQFDTADSGSDQLLNDYETGTWTPTYAQYGGATNGTQTYSAQMGFYVKIGCKVQVWFDISISAWSGASGTGPAIYGLPFPNNFLGSVSYYYTGLTLWNVDDTITGTKSNFTGWSNDAESRLRCYASNTAQQSGSTAAPMNVTGRIAGSLVYTTSS